MKKPFGEKWISDYYKGVWHKSTIDRMMDESNARSLELLEETGDDVSWEVFFDMKVLKRLDELNKEIINASAAHQ